MSHIREACECGIYTRPVDSGTHRGINWHTHEAPTYGVNGYMQIPEDHPWRELTYWEINYLKWDSGAVRLDSGANELTYDMGDMDGGWVGFDTQRAMDCWVGAPYQWGFQWTPELVAVNARRWCDLIAEAGDAK